MRKSYLYFVFVIMIFSISCTKDFGVKVTQPGAEFFLTKMQNGNWKGASVNGTSLTITADGKLEGEYTFNSPILGVGGIYKDNDSDKLIVAVPGPDGLIVAETDEKGKAAIDAILGVVGEEGGEKVISNLVSQVANSNGDIDLSDADKILAGTDLPPDKRAEVEAILQQSQDSFKNGQTIT